MTMKEIELEGFENQHIEVKNAGFFPRKQLFVNGKPAEEWLTPGRMLLHKDDGTVVLAQFVSTVMGFDRSKLFIDGQTIDIASGQVIEARDPMKWYEGVWTALPLLLIIPVIFVIGVDDITFTVFFILWSGTCFLVNRKILYSERNTGIKILLMGGILIISCIPLVLYFAILYLVIYTFFMAERASAFITYFIS